MNEALNFHQAAQIVAAMKRKPVSKIDVEHEDFGTAKQWVIGDDDLEFVAFAGVWAEAKYNRKLVDPENFYTGMPNDDNDSIMLASMPLEERREKWPVWAKELEGYWGEIRQVSKQIILDVERPEVDGEKIVVTPTEPTPMPNNNPE